MTNHCNKCRQLNELINEIISTIETFDRKNEVDGFINDWCDKQNKINGEKQ